MEASTTLPSSAAGIGQHRLPEPAEAASLSTSPGRLAPQQQAVPEGLPVPIVATTVEALNPTHRPPPEQEADLNLSTLCQFAKQHATSFRLISQQAHVVTLSFVQLSHTTAPQGVTAADCAFALGIHAAIIDEVIGCLNNDGFIYNTFDNMHFSPLVKTEDGKICYSDLVQLGLLKDQFPSELGQMSTDTRHHCWGGEILDRETEPHMTLAQWRANVVIQRQICALGVADLLPLARDLQLAAPAHHFDQFDLTHDDMDEDQQEVHQEALYQSDSDVQAIDEPQPLLPAQEQDEPMEHPPQQQQEEANGPVSQLANGPVHHPRYPGQPVQYITPEFSQDNRQAREASPPSRACTQCDSISSAAWRTDKETKAIICNACYVEKYPRPPKRCSLEDPQESGNAPKSLKAIESMEAAEKHRLQKKQQKAQAAGGQYFGRQIGDANSQIRRTSSFCILCHWGASGWAQNTPMECGKDLLRVLRHMLFC